jgi:histidine triad (HIT) family protein
METIFTKIANKELPAYILEENDEFMAFLDIYPSIYGQTLVIPKSWKDSNLFHNSDEDISKLMAYTRKIALKLEKILGAERCLVIFEGYGVPHLHARLYPVKNFEEANGLDIHKTLALDESVAKEILQKYNE